MNWRKINMPLIRKHINLSEVESDILEELKQEHNLPSISSVISYLIRNYADSRSAIENAGLISTLVKQELQEVLDVIRLRSGYTEKNVHKMMDVLNHLIISKNLDARLNEPIRTVREDPSLLFEKAQESYDEQIKRTKEINQFGVQDR